MTGKKPSRPLHFVDLFAGCGGLSLGLELAGFEPVFVNELNDHARATYLANRPQHAHLKKYSCADVKDMLADGYLADLAGGLKRQFKVDIKKGELDLVVGGPPCQGYSGIGHRRSYSVDKKDLPSNHLYWYMAEVIRALQPKMFLFENVRGLLNARWTSDGTPGEIFEDVKKTFRGLGYEIEPKLVFAKNFGVPQNRPRVLIVGVRPDLAKAGIRPSVPDSGPQTAPDLQDLWGDLVDPNFEYGGRTEKYLVGIGRSALNRYFRENPFTGETLKKGDPLTEHEYSNHSDRVIEKFEYMLKHNGEIPAHLQTKKFAQRLLPPVWGPEGPTITATSLPDDYVHYCQARAPTVREWARLQMFPDWYRFEGKRTTGGLRRAGNPLLGIFDREVPKYTQIGNAVPVGLARVLGEHFSSLLR